jgi:tetratricopeptide (TPR) repeat protein
MLLTEAFWAGGQGKDLTLRKAVDASERQVAEAFADRPLAEAAVREILGQAYLSLGDARQAVNEYERAYALRQAMQGVNHQSDTAACRNQLAVAYRLAGRTAEGARLFERNPNSITDATALAVRGAMLIAQKKPAEAELKLRECLTIREKVQPDDWSTFETKSILGEALLDQTKFGDAEPLLLSGYQGMKQHQDLIPSQDRPRLTKALKRLVKLYEAWGKEDQASKWRNELETREATKKS